MLSLPKKVTKMLDNAHYTNGFFKINFQVYKETFFRPFGPHFGLKIRGDPPLDPPSVMIMMHLFVFRIKGLVKRKALFSEFSGISLSSLTLRTQEKRKRS